MAKLTFLGVSGRFILLMVVAGCANGRGGINAPAQPVRDFTLFSTIDGTNQPCLFIKAGAAGKRPLLVLLHTWSSAYRDFAHMAEWQEQAKARNWHILQPNFRGPNTNPEACASLKARQDIVDAVDFVVKNYAVDKSRIYVAGVSGGGHMALTLAAHAPDRWAAVSAWCPIVDLAAWHKECTVAGLKYADDIVKCCGSPPGVSPVHDEEYMYRSPFYHLARASAVPIDINAGIHDGHTGSVPIHHTIDAFNVLASALGEPPVTHDLAEQLATEDTTNIAPLRDPSYGRPIYCRATAGPSRVSIFEGGHEGIPAAACLWLAQHAK